AAGAGAPSGVLVVDEVVAASCGLGEDARVTVRAAQVTGAQSIEVQGLPPAGRGVAERVLRSALLGKVVRVGDSVTLLPRDLGPDFPTGDTTRTLRNSMGAQWSTELLTVTATVPGGIVSVQPTTAVIEAGGPGAAPAPGTLPGSTTTTPTPRPPTGGAASARGTHPAGGAGSAGGANSAGGAASAGGANSAGGAPTPGDGSETIAAVAHEDLV